MKQYKMTLIVELFGKEVVGESLDDVKSRIRSTPTATSVQKATMLKEYAVIRGVDLVASDFDDIK